MSDITKERREELKQQVNKWLCELHQIREWTQEEGRNMNDLEVLLNQPIPPVVSGETWATITDKKGAVWQMPLSMLFKIAHLEVKSEHTRKPNPDVKVPEPIQVSEDWAKLAFASMKFPKSSTFELSYLMQVEIDRKIKLAIRPKPKWLPTVVYKWLLHRLLVLEYFMPELF